jgi:arginine/lysine/ornithine decarboxylase
MELIIPQTLKAEHDDLHQMLKKATEFSGKTGLAAKEVARQLHTHFIKEEEFALPQLSLLPALAAGKSVADAESVITMSDKLKEELPEMLAEHKQIVKALQELVKCAKEEGHSEVIDFAEKLMLHAKTEEEVSYPAAILVGEFLKMKIGRAKVV